MSGYCCLFIQEHNPHVVVHENDVRSTRVWYNFRLTIQNGLAKKKILLHVVMSSDVKPGKMVKNKKKLKYISVRMDNRRKL